MFAKEFFVEGDSSISTLPPLQLLLQKKEFLQERLLLGGI